MSDFEEFTADTKTQNNLGLKNSLGKPVHHLPNTNITTNYKATETLAFEEESTNSESHLKRRLVDEGRKLLIKAGLNQLSLRKVAKEAGVSHTAPYRHFADKSELLVAIALEDYKILLESLEASVKKHPKKPVQQLLEAGKAYVKMFVMYPQGTDLMFGGTLKLATGYEKIEELNHSCLNVLERVISEGQMQGIFESTHQSRDLAVASWSMVHGISMLRSTHHLNSIYPNEQELLDISDITAKVLIAGLSVKH